MSCFIITKLCLQTSMEPSYLWNVRGCQSGNATGQATPTGQCGSEKAVTKDLRQRLEGPRFGWRDRPSCDLRVVD